MSAKKSSGAGRGDGRTRNWTFVLYPESAPSDWRDRLDEHHFEWVLSPLHDKDLNGDGAPKKPHFHILLLFAGVKTYEQVKEITDSLSCPIPQRCHSARAMVRYMAHLDNPDKAQYNPEDIKGFGGVDVGEMLRPCSSERYTLIREMIQFVKDNGIVEFQDLMDIAMESEPDTWFPLLCDNSAYVLEKYIRSQRHRCKALRDERGGDCDE